MMAAGGDGTNKPVRTLARRPTIRPRAVTPPRSATSAPTPTWRLPPVRLPSPRVPSPPREAARADARPVLLLVADASDQLEVARLHDEAPGGAVRAARRAPRAMALAASTVMVLAAVVVVVVAWVVVAWASGRPTEPLQTSAMSTRTAPTSIVITNALPARVPAAAAKADESAARSIPVFDVKSLPPAPRGK